MINSLYQVEFMHVQDNALKGHVPVTVFNMSSLTMLTLFGNSLNGGGIPDNICQHLPNIQVLNLGTIPDEIGDLQHLQVFSFGVNNLNGPIPSTIFNMSMLTAISLASNQLLDNLAELLLGGNQLSGSLPSCLGDFSAALRILSLGPNLLTSTIPSTLWGLEYILNLDLSANLLNGSVLEDIGKLKVLTALDLSNNQLSGSVPSKIGGLKDLVQLSLSNNNLKGVIPSSFGELVSLEHLDLSKNNLSGLIPESLEALVHLKYLNLSFNRLQGEIPTGGPFQNLSSQSFVSNGGLCGAARLHEKESGSCNRDCLVTSTSLEKSFTPITSKGDGFNIMTDVASSLEYLHHGHGPNHVVHCDVKPSNILLDDDMVAHVDDFGIARLLEFGMEGIISTRGDVYSFSVALMETFTRRKRTDEMFVREMNLKQWIANSLLPDAAIVEVVDADLLGTEEDGDFVSRRDCLSCIMRLALACCAELPEERINMQEALITLNKIKIKFVKDCGRVQS
ncbi:PREDICTED: probable LRR receptor [Prunus dulcis]|uniref:PREDICTED: probable LRR receptor n=1 Tax=Prunus dulcis TaxID=3755 RepID=A0A5E4F5R6_PRUDU|nr:PREDICTED: probable LRR receptor [Prunus dulcis]